MGIQVVCVEFSHLIEFHILSFFIEFNFTFFQNLVPVLVNLLVSEGILDSMVLSIPKDGVRVLIDNI